MRKPDEFFHLFVRPAYEAWCEAKLDVRLATIAISELDNLAEHWALSHATPEQIASRALLKEHVQSVRAELMATEPVLQDILDVHNSHKHGILHGRFARLKAGQVIEPRTTKGIFDSGIFNRGIFATAHEILLIARDDGTSANVGVTINAGYLFWSQHLITFGGDASRTTRPRSPPS